MATSASPLVNAPIDGYDWKYTTFGPYGVASFAGPIAIALPFRASEPVHIAEVKYTVGTVCSVSTTKLFVKTRASGVTVTNAAQVTAGADSNTLASLDVNSITVNVPTAATLASKNLLAANEGLVASCQTTEGTIAVGTALADAFITIKWRNAQSAARGSL